MIAVIDTNIIIERKLSEYNFEKGFITPSVLLEIHGHDLNNYLKLYDHKIEIREPNEKFVKKVFILQEEKNLLLSKADIEIIALTLELKEKLRENKFNDWIDEKNLNVEVGCLTLDNGVLHGLKYFDCDSSIDTRDFMFRCVSCFTLYENKKDFCKRCGSNLISRVSVRRENGKIKIFLKKGYKFKKRELKDKYGNILHSEDQKAYQEHIREKNKAMKE